MSLERNVKLPANTDLRPVAGNGRWVVLTPGLWFRAPEDLTEQVAGPDNRAQGTLSYAFDSLTLHPEDSPPLAPQAAARLMAAAGRLLDGAFAALVLTPAPRWQPAMLDAPQLAGPGRLMSAAPGVLRAHNRAMNVALAAFLDRIAAGDEGLEAAIAKALAEAARDLPLTGDGRMALELDLAAGRLAMTLTLPDPGLALPGATTLHKHDFGHEVVPVAKAVLPALRQAQAAACADWLTAAAHQIWPGPLAHLTVTVNLSPDRAGRGAGQG